MDYGGHRGYISLGAWSGLRPDGCFEGVLQRCALPGYPKSSVLTVSDFCSRAWRMEQGRPHPARSAKSQCQRIPHQRTRNRKSTTERCPRSSVDRPERQAICPRLPTPHRGSRRRTLLAIFKPSPPGREFEPRGSCSRTYSAECGESRSISDSTSTDHWGWSVRGQDSHDH